MPTLPCYITNPFIPHMPAGLLQGHCSRAAVRPALPCVTAGRAHRHCVWCASVAGKRECALSCALSFTEWHLKCRHIYVSLHIYMYSICMYSMNYICFWIKKKALEVLAHVLFQYKTLCVSMHRIYVNIHVFIVLGIKRNKGRSTRWSL